VVPFFFLFNRIVDELRQFFVPGAATHQFVQIVIRDGKQAGANLAIGSNANATAVSAEGMRNWRNDPDLAGTVIKPVAASGRAALMGNLHQWPILGPAMNDLVERDHNFRRLSASLFERHEFDETHHDIFFATKPADGNDLVLVEAAQE
jgi:hypothetical protein